MQQRVVLQEGEGSRMFLAHHWFIPVCLSVSLYNSSGLPVMEQSCRSLFFFGSFLSTLAVEVQSWREASAALPISLADSGVVSHF